MQESTLVELEKLFLALSDKTRLRLLALMAEGEVPVGFLADSLGESQPKISRHLAYLRSAGLVSTRREGKWVYYAIENHRDAAVRTVLNTTLRSILAGVQLRPLQTGPVADEYTAYEVESEIYLDPYLDDWAPAELEIHLL